MHISSEIGMQPKRSSTGQQARRSAAAADNSSNNRRERTAARTSSSSANPLLRTVYLPNEQAAVLSKTVESLQQQLVAHQQLAEERIQVRRFTVRIPV